MTTARTRCCGLAAWAAGGLSLLSCGSGGGVSTPQDPVSVPSCGELRCDSAITYRATLPAAPRDEVLGWTVTLCHQAVCASGRMWQVRDSDSFACGFLGPLTAACGLTPAPPPSTDYSLTVTFQGPGEDYQPEDRFGVRIERSGDGQAVIDHSATVGSYREERPNGEGCAPLCRSASLN
jgi:hypothetical protein